MKSTYFALMLALLLSVASEAPAEARQGSHSGTSSFKGGFSSQRSAPPRSLPPRSQPPPSRNGPGAFGSGPGAGRDAAPPPARSGSALSRDMDQSAAQANALKSLDARRAATNSQPLPPLTDPVARPGNQAANQPGYQGGERRPPVYQTPPPVYQQVPVYQQQSSGNGLMAGLMGFMLGRSLSTPQPVYYPGNGGHGGNGSGNNGNGGNNGSGNSGSAGDLGNGGTVAGTTEVGMPGLGVPAPVAAPAAPSFFASVLRLFAWLALLGTLGWLLYFGAKRWMGRGNARRSNYSFERK